MVVSHRILHVTAYRILSQSQTLLPYFLVSYSPIMLGQWDPTDSLGAAASSALPHGSPRLSSERRRSWTRSENSVSGLFALAKGHSWQTPLCLFFIRISSMVL
jgi:hypothetical protein